MCPSLIDSHHGSCSSRTGPAAGAAAPADTVARAGCPRSGGRPVTSPGRPRRQGGRVPLLVGADRADGTLGEAATAAPWQRCVAGALWRPRAFCREKALVPARAGSTASDVCMPGSPGTAFLSSRPLTNAVPTDCFVRSYRHLFDVSANVPTTTTARWGCPRRGGRPAFVSSACKAARTRFRRLRSRVLCRDGRAASDDR